MNSELTILVAFAAIAFGAALFTVVIEWLKTDVASAGAAFGGHFLGRQALEIGHEPAPRLESLVSRKPAANDVEPVAVPERPALIGDDETAVARLCLGWGGLGTIVGMAVGAALWGFVGALLGSVIASAVAIGLVVVAVLVRDRATLRGASHRS